MRFEKGWAFPDADRFMAAEMKDDGSYQRSHIDAALRHVTDFSIALDAGAHVGTWSRVLSGRFARVLAFEPSPDTFEALVANMTTFLCDNVEPRWKALGAEPGHVSMAPLDERAAKLQNTGARYVCAGNDIPRITVDSLELPTLGFLKMDVEGSEPLILEGARETLRRCRPIVLYENKGFWRARFGKAKDEPERILKSKGYQLLETVGKDVIFGPRP